MINTPYDKGCKKDNLHKEWQPLKCGDLFVDKVVLCSVCVGEREIWIDGYKMGLHIGTEGVKRHGEK